MKNSLSDNKREDSGEKVEEEQVVSKFLLGEKDDSGETVDEEDWFISNFLSDKKEDSQETTKTTTASDEDEYKFNPNFLSDDKRLSVPLQEQVPGAANNSSRSSLQQMYVPSDDEFKFDEDEDGFDEEEEQKL